MIKAVIFDCFGVLVSSPSISLIKKYPHFKYQIDDIVHQADYGLINHNQFKNSLVKLLGLSNNQINNLFFGFSIRDESAIEWVKELKLSGKYKIGMLSNVGVGIFDSIIDPKTQVKLFDDTLLSYMVGIAKPEIAIFELASERLGVKIDECVMIDDNPQNIQAAINAGMYGIVYSSLDQAKRDLDYLLRDDNA